MKKVLIVGTAPFPVALSTGRHIATGEVAAVELDDTTEAGIASGKLGLVPVIDPPEPPAAKTTRKIDNPTTSQETD